MTLTVLTWYWQQPGGRVQYSPFHISIWADMVRRNLSIPHRLACVTAEPVDLPSHIEIIKPPRDFEDVRIPTWSEARPQCLRRLAMFAPDAAKTFGDRFACMDLDCVIGERLDPLFDTKAEFKIAVGTAPGRPHNGSMMLLKAGSRPQAYSRFTQEGAAEAGRKFTGSDQAWIADCLPGEQTWGEADGIVYYGVHRAPNATRLVMFFPGGTKPWERPHDPWIGRHYRRSGRGHCLILSHEGDVWGDVERALPGGFDGVISSPEAARHWPGKIDAIARDNHEAALLARMHGFEQVTWCGEAA